MHKSLKKFTKAQRAEIRKQQLANAIAGEGKYLFQNNTSGELQLPKIPLNAVSKNVPKGGKFIGDSYFLQLVKTNDLKLIQTMESPMESREKLITEQPPIVTTKGTVEYVQQPKGKKLHEGTPTTTEEEEEKVRKLDVLLTEDPLGGVVIVD